ncbi:MAG TPA: hypothetical protein VGQ83_06320 [Polyangia bacterium]|jgi:hypothetical protein
MTGRIAVLTLVLAGCGASPRPAPAAALPAPPPASPPAPPASAPAAPPAPASSRPAPAAGLERRIYAVAPFRGRAIAVSLAVPAAWGTRVEDDAVRLRTCRWPRPAQVLSGLTIAARHCPGDTLGRACLARVAARAEGARGDGEWLISEHAKGPRRSVEARRAFVAGASAPEYVECTIRLDGVDAPRLDALRPVCDSITVAAKVPATLSPAVDARPTAAEVQRPAGGKEKAAADVAIAFLEAAGRRDAAAAARHLLGPAQCAQAPAPRRAACAQEVARVRAALPKLLEQFPAGFEVGGAVIDPDGIPGAPVLTVHMWSPREPCAEPQSLWVIEQAGRFFVAFAMKQ